MQKDKASPEAARRQVRRDLRGQPKRQRNGVFEFPRGGVRCRRKPHMQGILHQPIQVHGQGILRTQPRAGEVRALQGQEPRLHDAGEGGVDVLAHKLLHEGLQQRQNPLRLDGREVRQRVHGHSRHKADRRRRRLPKAIASGIGARSIAGGGVLLKARATRLLQ